MPGSSLSGFSPTRQIRDENKKTKKHTNFYRDASSARQPMVEFYLLTFPRFPLRKKEHKSYKGKNRTHDFRTSRCAVYLLDHSGDELQLQKGIMWPISVATFPRGRQQKSSSFCVCKHCGGTRLPTPETPHRTPPKYHPTPGVASGGTPTFCLLPICTTFQTSLISSNFKQQ